MSTRVCIVIVTYNAVRWLDYCLAPFAGALPAGWRVVVVDNMSPDGTAAVIRERFPWATLVESGSNLGFGRANNIALRAALEDGADYVFLLNQDARIPVEGIAALMDIHSRHPDYYIISPIHLAGTERELDLVFSNYCSPGVCPGLFHDALRGSLAEIYPADKGNAAAWLLSRDCLERVGGFHPYFYHYGEDDDYVNRVRHMGGKLGIAPGVFAAHNRVQEASTRPPGYKFLRKLVRLMDPARKKPGKLAVLRLFLPALLQEVLRRRPAVASHYARVMADMLRHGDPRREQAGSRACFLR